MKEKKSRKSKKIGLPPGTILYTGDKKIDKPVISAIDYNQNTCSELLYENIEETYQLKNTETVSWINIDGLHDTELIEKIGVHFNIHPLILEDIVSTGQRPKVEFFDNHIYCVLKMIYLSDNSRELVSEQVSMVFGNGFLISFQEKPGDVFEPVRNRIRGKVGRIRRMNSDYLAYALIDVIVDNYFLITEHLEEIIEHLEETVLKSSDPEILHQMHMLKSQLIYLRKAVSPLKEEISVLEKAESDIICPETKIFIRDLYDHTIQAHETIFTMREMLSGILDIYLSNSGNRMNEIMKVLTIISTIFIPITFIAGIYGMNFDNMPELHYKYGYFIALALMAAIARFMVKYFKSKNWL